MFISDKVSSMTKLQPNTVIRAALDLLNEVGVDGLKRIKTTVWFVIKKIETDLPLVGILHLST